MYYPDSNVKVFPEFRNHKLVDKGTAGIFVHPNLLSESDSNYLKSLSD
jgi:hypothetical protein